MHNNSCCAKNMGINKWMKAKIALGLNCLYVPKTLNNSSSSPPPVAAVSPPRNHPDKQRSITSSSSSSYKSGKNICAICLTVMKSGHGHAIFTAECSHAFHFHCIASNVKHGKQTCPICRAKWKEVPFQSPVTDKSHRKPRTNNAPRLRSQEDLLSAIRRQIPSPIETTRISTSNLQSTEPNVFDDDDEITSYQTSETGSSSSSNNHCGNASGTVEVKTFPEVSSIPKMKSHDNFCVLIHLKAPITTKHQDSDGVPLNSQTTRAAIDLVTVLDVSGSMAGTKLALLKRAMGFVIQNLGPSDRLSVIAFSSTAKRLFPLRRMNDTGKNEALQAVNALSSNGGTNIIEALRKAAKVISERRWKNSVSSIILLSDGQDTYTTNVSTGPFNRSSQPSLLPPSMRLDSASGFRTPVHAFGFGTDHDAVSMHSISEASGGTFSFIEAESMIQDAFAQCIGGLLSVVVQDVRVEMECVDPISQLVSIKSGSYKMVLASDRKRGSIEVGDLYAEEERDFLVMIDIPVHMSPSNEMSLLKVKCVYAHPVTKNMSSLDSLTVKIQRPMITGNVVVSLEVDKQLSRIRSAEAMAEARNAAERGDLAKAVSVLENCRKKLSETKLARSGERLYVALNAELQEMQERMASRQVYETSGRAYVLSGLSSHSWQRATARGDSTESSSLIQAYQTQSMVDMVNLSQTMVFGGPSPPTIRPTRSFTARLEPR